MCHWGSGVRDVGGLRLLGSVMAGDPRRLLQAGSRGELCGPGFMDGPHVMKCRETVQLHEAVSVASCVGSAWQFSFILHFF